MDTTPSTVIKSPVIDNDDCTPIEKLVRLHTKQIKTLESDIARLHRVITTLQKGK